MSGVILHIISRNQWESEKQQPEIRVESLESQGFIHFSTPAQVTRVADAIFRGETGLALLVVDAEKLIAPLRWEPPDMPDEERPASRDLFPHLYGPLNTGAVLTAVDFPPEPDGTFHLPAALEPYLRS